MIRAARADEPPGKTRRGPSRPLGELRGVRARYRCSPGRHRHGGRGWARPCQRLDAAAVPADAGHGPFHRLHLLADLGPHRHHGHGRPCPWAAAPALGPSPERGAARATAAVLFAEPHRNGEATSPRGRRPPRPGNGKRDCRGDPAARAQLEARCQHRRTQHQRRRIPAAREARAAGGVQLGHRARTLASAPGSADARGGGRIWRQRRAARKRWMVFPQPERRGLCAIPETCHGGLSAADFGQGMSSKTRTHARKRKRARTRVLALSPPPLSLSFSALFPCTATFWYLLGERQPHPASGGWRVRSTPAAAARALANWRAVVSV